MEIKYDFLLIEDNHIDQFVMTQLFKKVFNVTEVNIANNGREGIDWIYENRRKISNPLVILLDIQMPIMNGLQFLFEYECLEEELRKETQIFMLSSSLDIDEIQFLKDNKYVTDFLSKPISIDRFRERLNTCL
ncbi:response regulator [Flavobacterium aquiphilum]|uniref:response regulator n=1 Tax=Flavobacterium aquiphilum TaxID=3003261 RepID=UPI0024804561|nr:response regulator [Flavobacterium aquiphilum]